MSGASVFRLAGYLPTGGGQYAAHLQAAELGDLKGMGSTTLWSDIQDEGKAGLRRALLEPANLQLLSLLVGEPCAAIEQAMVLPGGAEGLDAALVLSLAERQRRLLLLADCEPVGATKPSKLRLQCARAHRACRALINAWQFEPPAPEPRLLLLAPWRPAMDPPQIRHRPAWDGTAVPRPTWWGYLPMMQGDDELVAFARWRVLDAEPWARRIEAQNSSWLKSEAGRQLPASGAMRTIEFAVDLGEPSMLTFLLDRGPFRARLRVPAVKHRRALLDPRREDAATHRLRHLRDAVYEGRWGPTGWAFAGEIVESGTTSFGWRWTRESPQARTDWVVANSEAETFAITLKMFLAGT